MTGTIEIPEVLTGFSPIPAAVESGELIRIGDDLGDRYEVRKFLARGGFASVWEAYDRVEGLSFAVKRLDQKPSRSGDFYRELRAMFRLRHPNIVRLVNVLEVESRRYLILELCEGLSLRQVMSQMRNRRLRWPDDRVKVMIGQMAGGLMMAHAEGLTHRDIKPENALFALKDEGDFGGQSPLRLADFGLASGLTPPDDGRLRSVTGSPAYMAPEQFCGKFGPASDVYALGVVAYELLTGDVPFHGMPNELGYKHLNERPGIPSELIAPWDQLLTRMLAKRPDDRPTAADLVTLLSSSVPPHVPIDQTPTPKKRMAARPKRLTVIASLPTDADTLTVDDDRFIAVHRNRRTVIEPDGTFGRIVEVEPDDLSLANGILTKRVNEVVSWRRPFDPGVSTAKWVMLPDGSSAITRLLNRPELVFLHDAGTDSDVIALPGIPWQLQGGDDFVLARILTGRGFRLYSLRPGQEPLKLTQSGGAAVIAANGSRSFAAWADGRIGEWTADGRVRFARLADGSGSPRGLAVRGGLMAVLLTNGSDKQIQILQWGSNGGTP